MNASIRRFATSRTSAIASSSRLACGGEPTPPRDRIGRRPAAFFALGLPYWLLLGVFAAIAVALTQSWETAVFTAVAVYGLRLLKDCVVHPRVMGRAVGLSPARRAAARQPPHHLRERVIFKTRPGLCVHGEPGSVLAKNVFPPVFNPSYACRVAKVSQRVPQLCERSAAKHADELVVAYLLRIFRDLNGPATLVNLALHDAAHATDRLWA